MRRFGSIMFLSNIYSLCGSHLDVYLTFIVIDDSFSYKRTIILLVPKNISMYKIWIRLRNWLNIDLYAIFVICFISCKFYWGFFFPLTFENMNNTDTVRKKMRLENQRSNDHSW